MKKKVTNQYMTWVILVIGIIFLRSGYGKLVGGTFVDGLAKTLGFFASENPLPFVKSFLENIAIPNATLFGFLTMGGELYAGLVLISAALLLFFHKSLPMVLSILLITGLIVTASLNAVFLLSAGWTSPSTESVNLVMLSISILTLVYVMKLPTQVSGKK